MAPRWNRNLLPKVFFFNDFGYNFKSYHFRFICCWNEMKWNIGTYSTSVDSRDFAMFGPLLWPATLIGRIQIKTAWRFNRFGSSWFAMFPVFSIWCLVILVAVCEWFLEKWTSQRCQPMLRNFLFMILICIYPKVAFLSLRKYMSTFCQPWRLISFPSTSTS